jgi:hypothetical protein
MSASKFIRRRPRASLLGLASIAAGSLLAVGAGGALGASDIGASFSGGAGTVIVDGTLYAKQGGRRQTHGDDWHGD